jgi:hypothetical protein
VTVHRIADKEYKPARLQHMALKTMRPYDLKI